MGLFRRKKTEVIDLEKLNLIEEEQEKNFFEEKMTIVSEKNNQLNNEKEEIALLDFNQVLKCQKEINNDFEAILHEYYICKIFSRVALKDSEFNAQLIEINKYINTIKRKMYNIERMLESYKRNGEDALTLDELDKSIKDALTYEKIIKSRFKEINDSYYGHIKMTTLSVCLNKGNEGLEKFYESIHSFLSKFRGLTEAAEYIYYSSGDFLTDLVHQLVACIHYCSKGNYDKKYSYEYFLDSEVIITLDIKEWIDLFNKIRFAVKLIQDIEMDKFLSLKEKYDHLETIYAILMMRHEIASGQGKSI